MPERRPPSLLRFLPATIRGRLLLYFGSSIATLFVLMELLNVFGFPFGWYEGEYRRGRTSAIQLLNGTADEKRNDIVHWFEHRLAGLSFCINDTERLAAVRDYATRCAASTASSPPKPDAVLEKWLASLVCAFQYDAAEIVAVPSGKRLYATHPKPLGAVIPIRDELFGSGVGWRVKVTAGKDEATGKGALFLAVQDAIAAPQVALVFTVSLENPLLLAILHGPVLTAETGEISLVDMHKRLLTSLKYPLPDGRTAEPLTYQLTTRAAEFAAWGIDGTIETPDYRGVPVVAAVRHFRASPEFGMGIIVAEDAHEVFAPLRQELTGSMSIFCIGLTALLLLLYALATALLNPLEGLGRLAHRLEDGDFTARTPPGGGHEIQLLSKALNTMADKLQVWHREFETRVHQQTDEIRSLNTTLEQRVTERTAQLEAANRELEAFCYSVSHDLRAPLRHIDGYVELLVARCRPGLDDKGLHYLDTIAAAAREMGALIDNLLQFSRTGRTEMSSAPLSMNQLIEDVMPVLLNDCSGRRVEWQIGVLPTVSGDAALMRQVWANLLGNSVKYTRPRAVATITVAAVRESDYYHFSVADNGVGFDMRYAGKLFGVFHRLHSTEAFEGIGIGLATVQRIIARHGGRIWAEAELDRGATFHFTLPVTPLPTSNTPQK